MTKVLCDIESCIHWMGNECQCLSISLISGECEDFEEISEEILFPDVYYTRTKPNEVGKDGHKEWEQTRGKRIEFLGREMFDRNGYITDGRTGILLCSDNSRNTVLLKQDFVLKTLADAEEKTGLSPLYT